MRACRKIAGLALVFLATFAVAQKSDFDWSWRNQEVIGREDASIGNTSKLSESERSALIDAIVLRLQKPMGDAGYDDDRIREIATTTRIRFIDVGAGQPLIFTTSMGLEGGCDAMGNCPLWVFRHTDDGFVSLLNTIAASYTPQPAEGGFEVVFMHHLSTTESGLVVYRLADDKLSGVGCFTATWPKPSSDSNQPSDPKIEACKHPPLLESAPPGPPAPVDAEPIPQPPSAEQPAAQSKPESAESKEQASPSTEAPPQETPAPPQETPKAEPPPSAPDQAPTEKTDQAQPAPDQSAPKADEPQPQPPSDQPASDAKPDHPPADSKPDQAQPDKDSDRAQPTAGQSAPKADEPQPTQPPSDQPAPDAKPDQPADTKPDQAQPAPDQSAPKADEPQPRSPPSEQPTQPAPDNKGEPAPAQDQPQQQAPPATSEPAAPPPSTDAK